MQLANILQIIQIIIAVLLVAAVLVQQRGSGLSGIFGGEGASYHTKRGFEKKIFTATIILAVLFFTTSFINLFL
jgi:preprotein translocase subunit SecG